jgi:DNA-binding response OmpR family regulator
VEDNESIAKLVEFKLKRDGYRLEVRTNGIDGLSAVKSLIPDLVVLDVMMPGISGFELLAEMRKNEATKSTKVMMLTSKSREEDLQRGFELGVVEYMSKPFKVGELSMRIKKALEN